MITIDIKAIMVHHPMELCHLDKEEATIVEGQPVVEVAARMLKKVPRLELQAKFLTIQPVPMMSDTMVG